MRVFTGSAGWLTGETVADDGPEEFRRDEPNHHGDQEYNRYARYSYRHTSPYRAGERFGHLLASFDRCLSRLVGEHEEGTATVVAQRETVAVSRALHLANLASHGLISLWLGTLCDAPA